MVNPWENRGCPWKPKVFFHQVHELRHLWNPIFIRFLGFYPGWFAASMASMPMLIDSIAMFGWGTYSPLSALQEGESSIPSLSIYLSTYKPGNGQSTCNFFFVQPSSQTLSASLFFSKSKCLLVKLDNHWSIFSMDVWWLNPPISGVRNIYRTSQCLADHNPWFSVNFILIALEGEIFQKSALMCTGNCDKPVINHEILGDNGPTDLISFISSRLISPRAIKNTLGNWLIIGDYATWFTGDYDNP